MRRRWRYVLASVMMALGLSICLGYFLVQKNSAEKAEARIHVYRERMETMPEQQVCELGSLLKHVDDGGDAQEKLSELLPDGVAGILEIPSLDLSLPIYPDTEQKSLKKGCGHLKQSDYPGSGREENCVLLGHSGLSYMRIFDSLGQLQMGAGISLTILSETYFYQVVDIVVCDPEELCLYVGRSSDQKLLTLITCTPVGINSHRLIVRAERLEGEKQQ